jgi:hypothetical protein
MFRDNIITLALGSLLLLAIACDHSSTNQTAVAAEMKTTPKTAEASQALQRGTADKTNLHAEKDGVTAKRALR